jgi:hypothetical protein
MPTLLRLLGAVASIGMFLCGRSSPRGLCHAAQECRATASALLGTPHHTRSPSDHEPPRGSVQAVNPVAARRLHRAPDGTPMGSSIGIRQGSPFPRRGRCATTPGLHDRTPSGSSRSHGLDGSSEPSSPRGVHTFLGLRLRPRRSGALPGDQRIIHRQRGWRQQSGHLAPSR